MDWMLDHYSFIEQESKTPKFLGFSVVLHLTVLVIIALAEFPLAERPKVETISIEIQSAPLPRVHHASVQPPAAPTFISPPKISPPKIFSSTTAKAVHSTTAKAVHSIVAQPKVRSNLPQTLDDIQTPDLEKTDVASVRSNINPEVFDQDLNNDFEVINKRHKKSLEKEQQAFARQAARIAEEGDQNLAQAAQANKQKRNQELADAQNVPKGVRDLSELKQKPGNPRPLYDENERFQQQQGQISFLAYVTREGSLTQFHLLKSTGFRNLDSKTLRALKQWRFFPGQEGWVEIPFNWNLKGGPQEMHTLLRRSVSQN